MKIHIYILAFLFFGTFPLMGQESLSVGDKAPVFKAVADDGSSFDLGKYIGSRYIVVYFFPGALTAGCTAQACSYRDHIEDLSSANAMVVGISGDNINNLKLFKQAENLNFPLIADEKGTIAKTFGVPLGQGGSITRTVDGKEYELTRDISIRRWTFIIGKDGKIIYKNESVNPQKDSEEILAFLGTLK
jgi:peroxiredoxin Q/BCP